MFFYIIILDGMVLRYEFGVVNKYWNYSMIIEKIIFRSGREEGGDLEFVNKIYNLFFEGLRNVE